jgi:hypothetical protein
VALSLLGLSLVIVGVVLLYMYRDPKFGHGVQQSTFNPRTQRIGARSGLALVLLGSALQIVAVAAA